MKTKLALLLFFLFLYQTGWAEIPLNPDPFWNSTEMGVYSTGGNFGDIDKNGYIDFAVSNGNDMAQAANFIYFNFGGNLENTASWHSTDLKYSGHSALGDVNKDGFLDFAVSNYIAPSWGKNTVQLYLNNAGTLATSPSWESKDSMHTFACAFGDANGDGYLDLAISCGEAYNSFWEQNRIYFNHNGVLDSLPGWKAQEFGASYDVAWGDVNNDGLLDVAFISTNAPIRVYKNYGDSIGTKAFWHSYKTNYDGNTIAWGDMNNDGFLDLAVADNTQLGGQGYFEVYLNRNGVLDSVPSWKSSNTGYGSAVGWCDVNNDGYKDLAAGRWWGYTVVYENLSGMLGTTPTWSCNSSWQSVVEEVVWGDVDNDGVACFQGERLSGNGQKKVFYLKHYPAQFIDSVLADGRNLNLTEYCYDLASGWVSLAVAPDSEISFYYKFSRKPDLAVTNWDRENYVFQNNSLSYITGDANRDGIIDIGDIVYLINFTFYLGTDPVPLMSGDVTDDYLVDIADVVYLINYVFYGGKPPIGLCE
jgi:hypothetical protein